MHCGIAEGFASSAVFGYEPAAVKLLRIIQKERL
jgi:hypothetical protein